MLYEIKHHELTSYRELLIDVISEQHKSLDIRTPKNSYWSRFNTEYLESLMFNLSKLIKN
jgi:hypothetical protein